jgi:hypothetical protein
MPRVLVTDDSGQTAWNERVTDTDFDSDHFRAQFSDRLSWAVADAARSQTSDRIPTSTRERRDAP